MPAETLSYPAPPRLHHSLMELGRIFWEVGSGYMMKPLLRSMPRGDGHSVMTLPGFMGADGSTSQLRKFLNNRGYKAIPWGLGRNASEVRSQNIDDFLEHRAEMESVIADLVEKEYRSSGRKVTLIGWSLVFTSNNITFNYFKGKVSTLSSLTQAAAFAFRTTCQKAKDQNLDKICFLIDSRTLYDQLSWPVSDSLLVSQCFGS